MTRRYLIPRLALLGLLVCLAWLCAPVVAQPYRAAAAIPPQTQPMSGSVPAARAADRIVIIPIHGPIDRTTASFVRRRLDAAVREGANAVVFDIDSPGGELNATLRVCSLIKASKIPNTVAWVNPQAISGGAIVALACREIVVTSSAYFGDALPVQFLPWGEVRPLPDAEREKFIGPLLAELVDSARRNGFDELLAQGFVRRGVELWLVEHESTGQRLFVNDIQYRVAVGEEPDRTATPTAPSVTGGRGTPMDPIVPSAPAPPIGPDPADASRFIPAAPGMSPNLVEEISDTLSLIQSASRRPALASPDHAGRYRPIEYVSDGYGVLTFKTPELIRFGLAVRIVDDEAELKTFFGATQVQRLPITVTERIVGFMTNPLVRGALIVVFLLGMFLEMSHPGVSAPGIIAALALLGLLVPPALIDMATWWEIIAVVIGIGLIAVEVFILPGFGVCGVAGIILLFVGLIGTFIQPHSGVFPSSSQQMREATWGISTVLVAFLVAGVAAFFLWRSLPDIPIVKKLILDADNDPGSPDDYGADGSGLLAAMAAQEPAVKVGDEGTAASPLRPTGRARFGESLIDVHADSRGTGYIESGKRVRVVRIEGRSVTVEPV
ncbi:MAG: hypothetical protein KF768_12230 [Phycisphaeraceae bacterium]|nr:hypothetical protein [Phycisphaeraceae bacterium]